MLDNQYYQWFRILMTTLIALVFLSNSLKRFLAKELYDFLVSNRDIIIGMYYIYIAYDLYITNIAKNK